MPRSHLPQQFLTPPETSNTQVQSTAYLSPAVDSNRSQSHSPRYLGYSEDRPTEPSFAGSAYPSLGGNGDQDANADPGVFETGDAGKGWYLGSASGSTPPPAISSMLMISVIYMNSIKNTASSGIITDRLYSHH